MKIDSLQVSDVKRVKAVSIEFNKDGINIIGGRNRQGKTSVLSAIMYALGGENFRPTNFQREGSEEEGFIRLKFDDGMIVERKGDSPVRVIDSTGKKCGQNLLNSFVSKFSIDLPKFLNGSDSEKANILLQIIGVGDQLKELEEEEKAKYEERTVVGRLAEQKAKACKELEFYPDVPENEVSITDLTDKLQAVMTRNAGIKASVKKIEDNKIRLAKMIQNGTDLENQKKDLKEKTDAQMAALQKQIELLSESFKKQDAAIGQQIADNAKSVEALADEITKAESIEVSLEDTSAIENEIKECENTNAKVRANKDRAAKLKEADDMQAKYDDLTQQVEDVRRRKKELLDGADLPYPGLSVQNGILYLNGKAWDCMSGAEQLIVSCSIAMRLNKDCQFVLMDKLEQFDIETLEEFGKWCESKGLQVIATRVSTGGECSIVIEDGYVVGQENVVIDKTTTRASSGKTKKGDSASPMTVSNGMDGAAEEVAPDEVPTVKVDVPAGESDAMKAALALLNRKRAEMGGASSVEG